MWAAAQAMLDQGHEFPFMRREREAREAEEKEAREKEKPRTRHIVLASEEDPFGG